MASAKHLVKGQETAHYFFVRTVVELPRDLLQLSVHFHWQNRVLGSRRDGYFGQSRSCRKKSHEELIGRALMQVGHHGWTRLKCGA